MRLPVVLGRKPASSNCPVHVSMLHSTAGYISPHLLASNCVVNPSEPLRNSMQERRQIVKIKCFIIFKCATIVQSLPGIVCEYCILINVTGSGENCFSSY